MGSVPDPATSTCHGCSQKKKKKKILAALRTMVNLEFSDGLVGEGSCILTTVALVAAVWHRFDPWPRNVFMLPVWQKKKEKRKKIFERIMVNLLCLCSINGTTKPR